MQLDHLFSGNALAAIDERGCLVLPRFVQIILERRCDAGSVTLGPHDVFPCLTGYGSGYGPVMLAELERRRRRDEYMGVGPEAHHARSHRLFGAAEQASFDSSGRVALPAAMRRRGRIADLALFVGAGGTFEIWNPALALESGDEDLREIAAFRLATLSHS